MNLKSAVDIPRDSLLEASNDAFSDYVVAGSAQTREQFDQMLRQRGFDPALSRVVMDGDTVAAFWFVGTEPKTRPGESYGISVGTRPSHRRRGLSRALFEHLAPALNDAGNRRHTLEVIEINEAAVKLYQKLGFKPLRRVECFKGSAPQIRPVPEGLIFKDVSINDIEIAAQEIREWRPTWQNTNVAMNNLGTEVTATVAYMGMVPVAYGLLHRPYGQVAQIGVDPSFRRKGIGTALLDYWARAHDLNDMVTLNVPDTDKASHAFFAALGWENHIN